MDYSWQLEAKLGLLKNSPHSPKSPWQDKNIVKAP